MHKIIAIVGMCGSGKSELTKLFLEDGYQNIHFGDVTMNIMKERGMEVCEANERIVREEVRGKYGLGAYAILLLPEIIKKASETPLVLDGLYSWSELKYLREKLGDEVSVLAVIAGRGTRKSRLATREIRPLTDEETDRRDTAEIENLEKGGPIAAADYYIMNEGDLDTLRAAYAELKKVL